MNASSSALLALLPSGATTGTDGMPTDIGVAFGSADGTGAATGTDGMPADRWVVFGSAAGTGSTTRIDGVPAEGKDGASSVCVAFSSNACTNARQESEGMPAAGGFSDEGRAGGSSARASATGVTSADGAVAAVVGACATGVASTVKWTAREFMVSCSGSWVSPYLTKSGTCNKSCF